MTTARNSSDRGMGRRDHHEIVAQPLHLYEARARHWAIYRARRGAPSISLSGWVAIDGVVPAFPGALDKAIPNPPEQGPRHQSIGKFMARLRMEDAP